MKALGYVEGQDFRVDWRFAGGRYDRLPDMASDLVKSGPDVIVATTQLAVRAAQRATTTIPIVMAIANDPVQMGLVASIARPGGNTTGATSADEERLPKQLDHLAMMVPNLSRVAMIGGRPITNNPRNNGSFDEEQSLETLARNKGVTVVRLLARNRTEIENAFASMQEVGIQAVIVRSNPFLNEERSFVAQLALAAKLPSISTRSEFVEAGGLMSYGESLTNAYRRVAYFVDKILKGEKPANLPIELPTILNLEINQKTANGLGLTIPMELLTLADKIVE